MANPTSPSPFDAKRALALTERAFADSIVRTLTEYITIPNKSPAFDPEWKAHGHMDRAVALVEAWCREHAPKGTTVEVVRLENRTPVIFMESPGDTSDTVLLYGHLDKQPEMTGWSEGLGPWTPVLRGDRLYGRGGADDGYAAFASVTALNVLADQGVKRARCVVLIEACEESGSFDLPFYIEALAKRIGQPSLVVCLDSGCGNYDQLWCTTSLRGLATGTLRVDALREGVHSGDATGIIPSSFRIIRHVLSRLEDPATGEIVPRELHVDIPVERREQARRVAEVLGADVYAKFPLFEGETPITSDVTELVLNRTWRPTLAVTGAAGMPALADAGNVLRPFTTLRLSIRLPPTAIPEVALPKIKAILEADPPYGAKVSFSGADAAAGWNAPALSSWLESSLASASRTFFGKDAMYMGEGGSIPFMAMLGKRFPEAQFMITGVLGPHSNAHGPNEFLDLPTAKKLTCCVAQVLRDHAVR